MCLRIGFVNYQYVDGDDQHVDGDVDVDVEVMLVPFCMFRKGTLSADTTPCGVRKPNSYLPWLTWPYLVDPT